MKGEQPLKRGEPRRRYFIGGSDARIIMGDNEEALLRLWREKRGEVEPKDLSGNLLVQLGVVTEELNRRWYETNTGQILIDVIRSCAGWRPRWMAGYRAARPCSRPSSCSPGRSRKKRRCRNTRRSSSTICGWRRPDQRAVGDHRRRQVDRSRPPTPIRFTQHLIVTAERKFWR